MENKNKNNTPFYKKFSILCLFQNWLEINYFFFIIFFKAKYYVLCTFSSGHIK